MNLFADEEGERQRHGAADQGAVPEADRADATELTETRDDQVHTL